MSIVKQQIQQKQLDYNLKYWEMQSKNMEVFDPNEIHDIDKMRSALNSSQNCIQVLPAVDYLQFGTTSLRYWANHCGVFSIPTQELANWLTTRHPNPKTIHEIGCGNGALARHLGMYCSDGRLNQSASQIARILGSSHAVTPNWVATKEATQAIKQYKPKVVLAQWVTPGGGNIDDISDGRNSYGPDYSKILQHCGELIFVGNRSVHDKALAAVLPPADKEYTFDWLLSRGKHTDQNFIRVWKGNSCGK
jgi:hypothetical protein